MFKIMFITVFLINISKIYMFKNIFRVFVFKMFIFYLTN